MNRMKEIANMFGLDLEEEFDIILDYGTEDERACCFNPYRFTEVGIVGKDDLRMDYLYEVITGEAEIKQIKFQVGDWVIGRASANRYKTTNEGWEGFVIGGEDEYGDIRVAHYSSEYDCLDAYWVEPEHFKKRKKI